MPYHNKCAPLTPETQERSFYLESDFMPGLRRKWCDEIPTIRIRHKGWFCDESHDSTIRGLVFRLPHGRGFLIGWSMGEGMASGIGYGQIWEKDDETGAAIAADSLAQNIAEKERECQEQETARIEAEEAEAEGLEAEDATV